MQFNSGIYSKQALSGFIRLLVSLVSLNVAFANNGAVITAGTVESDRIVLDGDFSDWPEETPWVPIEGLSYGDYLASADDCKAAFRVLCDRRKNLLFVAIQVEDDHYETKSGSDADWHRFDNVTLYLGRDHGSNGSIGNAFTIDSATPILSLIHI